jgi:hypothetical protein
MIELVVTYKPQQKVVIERKNRAIVGDERAMIHYQGLPLFLWDKECNTSIYLKYNSRHKVSGNMSLEEDCFGKNPKVQNYMTFWCLTHSNVPYEKFPKLEPTTEYGIFFWYREISKAFCIYISSLRKIVVRWDVRFEEDRAFRRS